MTNPVSNVNKSSFTNTRVGNLFTTIAPLMRFIEQSAWVKRKTEPEICDFLFGNPQEIPLPEFVEALNRSAVPQNINWYAYKDSEASSEAIVAESLRQELQLPFEDSDILMTNGAFAGLAVTLGAVVEPGDEVIFISPPWFFYEGKILNIGATPVRVKINPDTFDLDLEAIAAAITDKTRAIIINTPHNPTGKIYPPETLKALAKILQDASDRNGREIYLISDEAYRKIIYDGRSFYSPAAFYDNTFVVYTYGKILLTPGQRIGYIALGPNMPNREEMRTAIITLQYFTGYAFPNALLQHSLAELDPLSIDLKKLQAKRDWFVKELRQIGYEVNLPESTFYLMVKSPIPDDEAFIEVLAKYNVFCLPGTIVELPGYFRISLTANEDMMERSLPGFQKAIEG